jgi:hypothetical protein
MPRKKGRQPAPIDVEPDMAPDVFAQVHPKATSGDTDRIDTPVKSAASKPKKGSVRRTPRPQAKVTSGAPHPPRSTSAARQDQHQLRAAQEGLAVEREGRRQAEQLAQAATERTLEAERRAKKAEAQARKLVSAGAPPARATRKRKPRGAVHEELHQIALRLPPTVMAKLEATAAAYGLDKTAAIKVAIVEQFARARAKGLIPENDEGSDR